MKRYLVLEDGSSYEGEGLRLLMIIRSVSWSSTLQ
jgi:hypothetical protein